MRRSFLFGAAVILAVAGGSSLAPRQAAAADQTPGVLLVCNGSTAPCPAAARPYYRTVQGAVDAARPGDWILIYPGVYHEKSTRWPTAGVWIESANVDGRPCGRPGTGNDPALSEQLICNTGIEPCPLPPSKAKYPTQTRIVMLPVPRLASMPHPCAGVPRNAFCS
jgi:hypothetical protein